MHQRNEKKQDMFKKGLNLELRTLLTLQIYPDFNTLMNKAILTERAKIEERKDNKRKFLEAILLTRPAFQKLALVILPSILALSIRIALFISVLKSG